MSEIRQTIRDMDAAENGMRDERLAEALSLLQKPPRHRMPGVLPLLAGCAFIGAATLLAYVYTKTPMISAPAGKATTPAVSTAQIANKADFELSATAPANEVVTEAVPLGSVSAGSESAR